MICVENVDQESRICFFSWRIDKLSFVIGVKVLMFVLRLRK